MRREHIPIPKPRSTFLQVQCTNCGNEQIIFSATTRPIACKVCETELAVNTGGRARLNAVILRRLD